MEKQTKGQIILTVGLPGSGKSTYFHNRKIQPLSSDTLRLWLFDDETDQQSPRAVFAAMRMLLRTRLQLGRSINYVDATHLTPRERKPYLKMASRFGYDIYAVYFDTPLETCLRRNFQRNRTLPMEVMERFSRKLVRPTIAEGFQKVSVIRVARQ